MTLRYLYKRHVLPVLSSSLFDKAVVEIMIIREQHFNKCLLNAYDYTFLYN